MSPETRIPLHVVEKEPLQDHCGIVAIMSSTEIPAFSTGYVGLNQLQTRGYDGAGAAAISEDSIITHYGSGKIVDALGTDAFNKFDGHKANIWMFQTRYGTEGSSETSNLQPLIRTSKSGEQIAVITNGQYVYSPSENGESDTVQFIDELAYLPDDSWDEKILRMQNTKEGAWSTVVAANNTLYLMRDSHGIRPLAYGVRLNERTQTEVYYVASESAALQMMGVNEIIEVMPGSVLKLEIKGVSELQEGTHPNYQSPCAFEDAYFAEGGSAIHRPRQNSIQINSEPSVNEFRQRTGEILASRESREFLEGIDLVCGVPGTGIAGGKSYALAAGLNYFQFIQDVNPQDDERTFMMTDIQQRKKDEITRKIESHFYIEPAPIEDKNVLLVDDSLVRGNITSNLVSILKRKKDDGGYGVNEVHIRILFPPVDKPCHLGISTRKEKELLAAKFIDRERLAEQGLTREIWEEVVKHMREEIGADSLTFVTAEDIHLAAGTENLCLGCTIGNHPPANQQELLT